MEKGDLRPGSAVDAHGNHAIKAEDAVSLLPAGTIGNALGILIELLAANVGAGDPRLRSEPTDAVPDGEPKTCVFFAINLSVFDSLGFPNGRSRKENVRVMVDAIFEGNGDVRMVGLRKWKAKHRPEQYGGLLFAPESIDAFRAEAEARGITFPTVKEVDVEMDPVHVAGK